MLYPLDASAMPADMVDGLYKGAFATAKTATLKRIDGSRHFIMLDQPAAFAAAVDTFLAN
jgi:pimeloyl-ACP methyl ester carboxylesterase